MVAVPWHLLNATATVSQYAETTDAAGFTSYTSVGASQETTQCHIQATSSSEAQRWGREWSQTLVTIWLPEDDAAIAMNPGSSRVSVSYRGNATTFRVIGAPIRETPTSPLVMALLQVEDLAGLDV